MLDVGGKVKRSKDVSQEEEFHYDNQAAWRKHEITQFFLSVFTITVVQKWRGRMDGEL